MYTFWNKDNGQYHDNNNVARDDDDNHNHYIDMMTK